MKEMEKEMKDEKEAERQVRFTVQFKTSSYTLFGSEKRKKSNQ